MNGESRSKPPSRASAKPAVREADAFSRERERADTAQIPMTTSFLSGVGQSAWEGPAVGMLIDDCYRVLGPLGQGGMGVVVLAVDERLERDVAIKFIRPAYATREDVRERFLTEARAMARVRHENVVEIYAFGQLQSVPYFVMEYVPGTTVALWLKDAMYSIGMPRLDEALGFLDQICRGVAAIHASGAVHGDLKPTNVLIGPAFRVAIADLGMSRLLARNGERTEQTVTGTPGYMAPEIMRTDIAPELAHRADIYSLGVMAFEMLTAESPFNVKELRDLTGLHQIEPPRPSQIRRELSDEFDQALLGALRIDPAERTASVDDFRQALLQARQSIATAQRPLRILIANADADFNFLASRTLEQTFAGARIECVHDGDQALRAIELEPAALAVIDLDLPDMNGVELAATLRGTDVSRAMPIIVVTAAGHAPEWNLLSSLGVDGFLVKPLDPYALTALARKTLGGMSGS